MQSVQIRKSMMNNSLILQPSAFSDINSLNIMKKSRLLTNIEYLIILVDKQMDKEYLSIPIGIPIGNSDFFAFHH